MAAKSELRKAYLAKRQLLSQAERGRLSAEIAANFFQNFELSKINILHSFIPIERFAEIDTRPIFQRVWNDFPGIQTVVPRINHETEELESLKYGVDVELVENKWQIGEPAHDELIEPGEIDIVLVPLVCFDLQGHRVGYGKGYYDRFLKRCRNDCARIGLSFFEPADAIDDTHSGDIRLDHAVTPAKKYDFLNR
jgi:5-formyltetrahydrofolate cyclo-ligase